MRDPAIEIRNLTKYHGKQKGVEEISLQVGYGDIVGIVGPLGSGKTTILKVLASLMRPTSGTASIFGKDCVNEAKAIAMEVGYLSSEDSLYEKMKAKDFLKYTANFYGIDTTDRIRELSEALDLKTGKRIMDLSPSDTRKVSLAAALLHSPKLLLLDEPFSQLEEEAKEKLIKILAQENEKGATILFTSSILSEAQKICNKIAFIDEGELLEVMETSDLLHFGYKKISFTVENPVSDEFFAGERILDYEQKDSQISFLYWGDSATLVEMLNTLDLRDLFIMEPTIEEIFKFHHSLKSDGPNKKGYNKHIDEKMTQSI